MDEHQRYTAYRKIARIGLPVMMVLLAVSIGILAYSYSTTGQFFKRDISLSGGVTLTFTTPQQVSPTQLEHEIRSDTGDSANVRTAVGTENQVVIEAAIQNQTKIDTLVSYLADKFDVQSSQIQVDFIGETLGSSFYSETFKALLFAFVLMGLSILLIFRKWLPAFYVIFCAFADITMTVTTINVLGLAVSTGGLAAFLMLLGYSVDTDILLTTKMLKRQKEPLEHRFDESLRTGLTMSGTSAAAVVVGAIVSNSPLIREIMVIIAIGLVFDVLNTWLVNGQLVMRHLDREGSQ